MPEQRPRSGPSAVDRLTILYIVGTVLTLVAVFAMTIYTNAQLRRQTAVTDGQTLAIEELRGQVREYEQALHDLADLLARQRTAPATTEPATPTEPPTDATRRPAAAPSDAGILAELAACAPLDPRTGLRTVADRAAAQTLLSRTMPLQQTALAADTWEQLASLSLLLDDPPTAELLARRVRARGGTVSPRYDEMKVRGALAGQAITDAESAARALVEKRPDDPAGSVLLAAVLVEAGNAAAADQALTPLPDWSDLADDDRLHLARTLAQLDRWNQAGRVLRGWKPRTAENLWPANRLRAVIAVQTGDPVTALALVSERLASVPDDPAALLWRAAALVQAEQPTAAAAALTHPRLPNDIAFTWYWRGRCALLDGRERDARQHFERAVATDRRCAAAWEALAAAELNDGTPQQAATYLSSALEAAPSRASAHFLKAVIRARLGDLDSARAALARAVELDPTLRETARSTEALAILRVE